MRVFKSLLWGSGWLVIAVLRSCAEDAPTDLPGAVATGLHYQGEFHSGHPGKFWTIPTRIAFVSSVSTRTYDTVQTCGTLAKGGREMTIPSQTCAGVAAWLAASTVVEWGAAYWFHKHRHRWLAKAAEWSGAVGSGEGIVASKLGWFGRSQERGGK
jgi:hypothetical protein